MFPAAHQQIRHLNLSFLPCESTRRRHHYAYGNMFPGDLKSTASLMMDSPVFLKKRSKYCLWATLCLVSTGAQKQNTKILKHTIDRLYFFHECYRHPFLPPDTRDKFQHFLLVMTLTLFSFSVCLPSTSKLLYSNYGWEVDVKSKESCIHLGTLNSFVFLLQW